MPVPFSEKLIPGSSIEGGRESAHGCRSSAALRNKLLPARHSEKVEGRTGRPHHCCSVCSTRLLGHMGSAEGSSAPPLGHLFSLGAADALGQQWSASTSAQVQLQT